MGVRAYDEMIGGGQKSATITLVIGQSGTGKSTMSPPYVLLFEENGWKTLSAFLGTNPSPISQRW